MTRTLNRLSTMKVQKAKRPGMYCDGGGLYLRVAEGGSKQWVYRFVTNGRPRDMGLGGFHVLTLAEARERAREASKLRLDGIDPIAHKHAQRTAGIAAAASAMTFRDCFEKCLASHEDGWKNAEHRRQWRTSIEQDVLPVIGDLAVDDIGTPHIIKVLEPIWKAKPETASRIRGRIERVLAWATVRGFRSGDNPARWRGHLQEMFPAVGKIAKVNHHEAMPYVEVPGFMAKLRERDHLAARALEFTILTAARTGETLGARWDEIDLAADTWTVPAARMKAGKAHKVPLSKRAVELLRNLPRRDELIFEIGRVAMLLQLREVHGDKGPTVHGFRSSFRDWCSERTSYPPVVAEQALAHAVGNKVERAYNRTDLFEKRRKLMDSWSDFCAKPAAAGGGKVLQLRG